MSANNGPSRAIINRCPVEDGWTVITLECGHKCSVRGHHKATMMACWPCEDAADIDQRTADELTAARAHPHCHECRLVLEDCRCQP